MTQAQCLMSLVTVVRPRDNLSEICDDHLRARLLLQPANSNEAYDVLFWHTDVVGCGSICVFIVHSIDSKLSVIPRFARFISYSVALQNCAKVLGRLQKNVAK